MIFRHGFLSPLLVMDRFRKNALHPQESFLVVCKEECADFKAQNEKKNTLECLLSENKNLLFSREGETNKLGIHLAAESGNHILLECLLNMYKSKQGLSENCKETNACTTSIADEHVVEIPSENEDWLDKEGRTPLHYAAMQLCEQKYCHRYVKCVKLLIDIVEINRPDNDGYTAITYAVTKRHKDRLHAMLNSPQAKRINLDISTADGCQTSRSAINKFYPEISERLHQIPEFSKDTPENKLLASMIDGNVAEFESLFSESNEKNPFYKEPFHAYLIEIACALEQKHQFLTILLDHVDPNLVNKITKKPLLHLAVENGNKEALELLLSKEKIKIDLRDRYGCSALHHAAKHQVNGPRNISRLQACIDMLLNHPISKNEERRKNKPKLNRMFDRMNRHPTEGNSQTAENKDKMQRGNNSIVFWTDNEGNTSLHLAARFGHEETVNTLLKNDANLLAKNSKDEYAITAMDVDVLRNFLDDQIESANISMEDKEFYLEFNFNFLNKCSRKKDNVESTGMKALSLLSERDHLQELLKHPILESYLHLQWERVRYFFYLNLLFTVIFILLLSSYVLVVYDETTTTRNWFEIFIYSNSTIIFVILLIFVSLLALRELVQLISKRMEYFLNLENYMELSIIAFTFLVLFSVDVPLGDEVQVRKILSPLIILLAWTELVMITGRTPLLSPQLEMLKKVSKTFLQYMPWYMLVILAFSLSFYSLFRDVNDEDNQFVSPVSGFFKTVLMMTGEYDMQQTLYSDVPYLSHIVFLFFVFLVAIVMLNLLSGLAVGDTSQIRQKADVLSLVYIVKLVVYIEGFTRAVNINIVPQKSITIFPQKDKGNVIFGINKRIVQSALDIVARKKKTVRHKSAWTRYFRRIGDSNVKSDDNIRQLLDSFDKRLKSLEVMVKEIIDLNRPNAKGKS